MVSETPRTDGALERAYLSMVNERSLCALQVGELAPLCRELERELAAAHEGEKELIERVIEACVELAPIDGNIIRCRLDRSQFYAPAPVAGQPKPCLCQAGHGPADAGAPAMKESDAVEQLSAQLHSLYQAEARRQGDVRHADAYEALPENIKEFDRVLARFILKREAAVPELQNVDHAEIVKHLREEAFDCPLCAQAADYIQILRTACDPLASLDWNRLLSGETRALNPEHQQFFDAVQAAKEGK